MNLRVKDLKYCFRKNGQVYHALSQMHPEPGRNPAFSQIYIYDQEHKLDNQLDVFSSLDRNVLQELQDTIKEINPYAQLYCHAGDVIEQHPTKSVQLVLKCTGKEVDP